MTWQTWVWPALLAIVVFVADLMHSPLAANGAAYVVPVMLASRASKRFGRLTALAATILLLLGMLASGNRTYVWEAVCHRAVGVALVWVGALLIRPIHALALRQGVVPAPESEIDDRVRRVIQGGAFGLWELDVRTKHVWFSPHIWSDLGYSPHEIPRTFDDWMALIHPDDRDRVSAAVRELGDNDPPLDVAFRLPSRDGTDRWFRCRAGCTRAPDGTAAKVSGVCVDIKDGGRTQRISAEAARRYQVVIEAMNDGLVCLEAHGLITFVNRRFCEMLGYEASELIGRYGTRFLLDEANCDVARRELKRRKGGGSEPYELSFATKQGEPVHTIVSPRALFDDRGGYAGALAVVTDITERVRSEEALRRQALIIDQIHDSVIAADLEGMVTSWNRAAERQFDYSAQEALGRHISFVYPESEHGFLETGIIAPLKRKGRHELEVRLRKRSGEEFFAHLSLSILRDAKGDATGIIGYTMDITAKKEAEESLREAPKLQAAATLVSGLAHDFRNLTTALAGCLELSRAAVPETHPVVAQLDTMEQATRQAAGIADSLLAFSHSKPTRKGLVSLNEIFGRAWRLVDRLLPRAIEREYQPPDRRVFVYGDPVLLEQMIMNLVINARDEMPHGGRLRMLVTEWPPAAIDPVENVNRGSSWVRIDLSDTGPGIDPQVRDRLFETFVTTKPRSSHSGMGLAVVRAIVLDHGGEIEVQSDPDVGTTFSVFLPVVDVDLSESEDEFLAADERLLGPHTRVLVIEDDDRVRSVLASTLVGAGCNVVQAADLNAALAIVGEADSQLDAILADGELSAAPGVEIVRQLRSQRPEVPVLLVTGRHHDERLAVEAQAMGCRFLYKPFRVSEVISAVVDLVTETEQ